MHKLTQKKLLFLCVLSRIKLSFQQSAFPRSNYSIRYFLYDIFELSKILPDKPLRQQFLVDQMHKLFKNGVHQLDSFDEVESRLQVSVSVSLHYFERFILLICTFKNQIGLWDIINKLAGKHVHGGTSSSCLGSNVQMV